MFHYLPRSIIFATSIVRIQFQFFISALSFATFAVSPELPQNRLQLSFTLLLTSVTFKFVINQSLPKISYLTYMVGRLITSSHCWMAIRNITEIVNPPHLAPCHHNISIVIILLLTSSYATLLSMHRLTLTKPTIYLNVEYL